MPYRDPEEQRRYQREHYQKHKNEYIARARAREVKFREVVKNVIRDAKAIPCADCTVEYPYYVMQFDHLDNKEFNIANFRATWSLKRLLAEIAKCDVVCANCHAERTYQRRQAQTTIETS